MRNFIPPQTDEPEVFILDQDGTYSGTYGGKNGRPGKRSWKRKCTFFYLMLVFGVYELDKFGNAFKKL